MKYTIHGLQQQKLIDLNLNNDDALILSVLKDRYSSMKMEYKIIENQRYIWINYSNFIQDIPILYGGNSNNQNYIKRNLVNKLKKYEYLGLIKRVVTYEKNGVKGTFSYVTLTKLFDALSEYQEIEEGTKNFRRGYEKFSVGVRKNFVGGTKNFRNKDSSTIDSSTIDYSTTTTNVVVEEIFNKFKKIGQIKKEKVQKCIEKCGEDKVKYYLDNIDKFKTPKNNPIGFILKAIENDYSIPNTTTTNNTVQANKPIQSTNFDQREYSDDFFDSLYDNFNQLRGDGK
jgi:hypothetical protein